MVDSIFRDESNQDQQVNPNQVPTSQVPQPAKKHKFLMPLLTILAVILIVGGVGFGVWYWQNGRVNQLRVDAAKQKADSDKRIRDLQTQIDNFKKQSSTTTTTTNKTDNVLKITELGIQIALPASISDAYYAVSSFNSYTYAALSTKNLENLGGSRCGANKNEPLGPIGSIAVLTTTPPANPTVENTPGELIKQVGNKYIYYKSPQSVCSETPNNKSDKAETDGIAAIQEALKTATAIQ